MADDVAPEIPARMLPKLDDHNRTFWTGGADGQLHIAWCDRCRLWVQPPGADCPDCGGALVDRPVSGRGSVFTYTVNYQPYMPNVPVPYVIAIVELEEQADLRIATNIVDCEPDSVMSACRWKCASNATRWTGTPSSSRCSHRGPSGTRIRAAPNRWRLTHGLSAFASEVCANDAGVRRLGCRVVRVRRVFRWGQILWVGVVNVVPLAF